MIESVRFRGTRLGPNRRLGYIGAREQRGRNRRFPDRRILRRLDKIPQTAAGSRPIYSTNGRRATPSFHFLHLRLITYLAPVRKT